MQKQLSNILLLLKIISETSTCTVVVGQLKQMCLQTSVFTEILSAEAYRQECIAIAVIYKQFTASIQGNLLFDYYVSKFIDFQQSQY